MKSLESLYRDIDLIKNWQGQGMVRGIKKQLKGLM